MTQDKILNTLKLVDGPGTRPDKPSGILSPDVYIDGLKIKALKEYEIKGGEGQVPMVSLIFYADVEVI